LICTVDEFEKIKIAICKYNECFSGGVMPEIVPPKKEISFEVVKSLSPKSVLEGNPCTTEFENYCKTFGFVYNPTDDTDLKIIEDNKVWKDWLLSKGYIKTKGVEFEVTPGDIFEFSNGIKVMVFINPSSLHWNMIWLNNSHMGNTRGRIYQTNFSSEKRIFSDDEFRSLLNLHSSSSEQVYKSRIKD
jgi:hypothetical protein